MSTPVSPETQGTSTRPYLIRALHDWCTDNGFTPYVAVFVGPGVRVPLEYVKNGEIVLNVGFEATSGLRIGNDVIEFKARFGGVAREIVVPIDHVIAIYARENGQGMAFPVPGESTEVADGAAAVAPSSPASTVSPLHAAPAAGLRLATPSVDETPTDEPTPPPAGGSPATRPSLKRVK